MEFYTSFSQKRPKRLLEETRKFAFESLYEHKYGLETKANPYIDLTKVPGIKEMEDLDKYDLAIRMIAEYAPIRICKGERISTSATLGDSIDHKVPVRIDNELVFLGISHLTVDFQKVLDIGINGISAQIKVSKDTKKDNYEIRFLESCESCIESFRIWLDRYIRMLSDEGGYERNINSLSNVPFSPPKSFHEAVQSIWAVFAFCRLCGNWPGIGRIDMMLGKYLKDDLEKGTINIEEAREILAHFFIKGCEWVCGGDYVSGDAQHYQNLVLAGVDKDGNDITNDVTYLVLDIIEELGISDFPTTVRISENSPKSLIERVSDVIRYGGGTLAIYNEDLIINALCAHGYPLNEARNFANDGCWEVQIPGKTYFGYTPFDALSILQQQTLDRYSTEVEFTSFEELYKCYISHLKEQVSFIHKERKARLKHKSKNSFIWNESVPCTVISIFEEGCIRRGRSYTDGGTDYTVISPHLGGLADVTNNLYAIKKLVFDDKLISFTDLMELLKGNWESDEALRIHALKSYEYYGNDNDEVDHIACNILSDFAKICNELEKDACFAFPPGVSTFGRQIDWAKFRYACANGIKAGEILANNMTPTPGTAIKGATAIIKSYCKADLSEIINGAALDLRLLPGDVKGEKGILAISSLIMSFVALGGFFMQIDIADGKILRDAQQRPENYPALAVRVAGWSARFVTLSKEWQDMIINNIEKNDGE